MSRRGRRRACAAGFILASLLLLVLGMPERLAAASHDVPVSSKLAISVTIMGVAGATMLLAAVAVTSRMLEWTRASVARIDARRN